MVSSLERKTDRQILVGLGTKNVLMSTLISTIQQKQENDYISEIKVNVLVVVLSNHENLGYSRNDGMSTI